MKENLINDTLNLMKIPGLSGYEDRVRDYISDELSVLGITPFTDKLGNLRIKIPGDGPHHAVYLMDQLGRSCVK